MSVGDCNPRLPDSTRGGFTDRAIEEMQEMLDHFLARLASVNKLPDKPMGPRTKLEYGRHYGFSCVSPDRF